MTTQGVGEAWPPQVAKPEDPSLGAPGHPPGPSAARRFGVARLQMRLVGPQRECSRIEEAQTTMNPLIAMLVGVLLLAGAGAAYAQPASAATASAPTPQSAGRLAVLRYTAPVPASWQAQTPASSFRAAQYRVPAAAGASDGELVVFYFGRGQGGSAAANAQRWASQFTGADGQPVPPKIATLNVQGMTATVVELNGSYARGVGMGPIGAPKPDQTLLAAVIETPEGHVIVQLHGDRATVAAHRSGFEALVSGFGAAG